MMDGETREMKRERWWPGSERGQRSGALREIVPLPPPQHGGGGEAWGEQREYWRTARTERILKNT